MNEMDKNMKVHLNNHSLVFENFIEFSKKFIYNIMLMEISLHDQVLRSTGGSNLSILYMYKYLISKAVNLSNVQIRDASFYVNHFSFENWKQFFSSVIYLKDMSQTN